MSYLLSNLRRFSFAVVLCVACRSLAGDGPPRTEADLPRPVYEIHRVTNPLTIDGRLDEPAWFAAPSTGPFHFTWYKSGRKEQTVAKLLWDDEYLYVGHICQDAHLTARHTEHDGPIPQDDCFEIIIVPNPERPTFYYNIEWNVIGGYVDGHRPDGANAPREPWDVEGLEMRATFQGTPNDDTDTDQWWAVEVAIPLANFAQTMSHVPPRPGDAIHANLNRHGGDTNLQYSQWARGDTPTPSFHTPHCFGRMVFSARTVPFATVGDEADNLNATQP